jgi:IclR family acetate operon transcriptional repressor
MEPFAMSEPEDTQKDGGVPNLIRGLNALERLATHPQGLLAAELARMLDAPKNSMGRILSAMMDLGFVMKGPTDNRFRVTRKLLHLGSASLGERHLVSEALDEMYAVRDQLDETVLLNIPMGDHGITLEQVPPRKPIHIRVQPGARFELYNTAPGKLFLAALPEAGAQAYLRRAKIVRSTPQTLSRESLTAQLAVIRRQQYATDRGEALEGSNCVSAPVRDANGACIGALTATGFSATLPERRFPEVGAGLIAAAERISRRLGWDGSPNARPPN